MSILKIFSRAVLPALIILGAFVLAPACRAETKTSEPDYEKIYGPNLYDAPSVMRDGFFQNFGKQWQDATLDERKDFIRKWKAQQKAVEDAILADKKAKKEKEKALEKLRLERKRAEELKKEAEKRKAEAKLREKDAKDRELERNKEARKRKLEHLKERQEQRRSRLKAK